MRTDSGDLWPTEGESYDTKTKIYTNNAIDNFLDNQNKTILIAPKGMGKTLLLKKKRSRVDQTERGIHVIPADTELDYIRLPHTFSRDFSESLKDLVFWKIIWEIAIGTSILLNAAQTDAAEDFFDAHKSRYPELVQDIIAQWLRGSSVRAQVKPSTIVSSFLIEKSAVYHEFQRRSLFQLYQTLTAEIRNGVYVFIDSFDQELRQMSMRKFGYVDANVWRNGQLGLVKAAWDINRGNPHVKVYTSARQEAWAKFEDEDRQVIFGHVLQLAYSATELRGISDVLFREYEAKGTLEDYLGFETIENKGQREDVFNYLIRHSLGRPRGIAVIGGSLHGKFSGNGNGEDKMREFRRIVNESAPEDLIGNYLNGEMRPFLTDLQNDERVDFIWRNLPSNILNMDDLKRIRKRFAKAFDLPEDQTHPFCELLNLGLLGYVEQDVDGKRRQVFRSSTRFSWAQGRILPGDVTYVVHPALTHVIRMQNANFTTNDTIITGHDIEWPEAYVEAEAGHHANIFISYATRNATLVGRCVSRLADHFDANGFAHKLWMDKFKIRAGEGFQAALEKGLRESDVVLLFYTKEAEASGWVEREWRQAELQEVARGGVKLIPVTNDPGISSRQEGFLGQKQFHLIKTTSRNGPGAFDDSMIKLGDDIRKHIADLRA